MASQLQTPGQSPSRIIGNALAKVKHYANKKFQENNVVSANESLARMPPMAKSRHRPYNSAEIMLKISGISTLSITVTIFYKTELSKFQRTAGKCHIIGTMLRLLTGNS